MRLGWEIWAILGLILLSGVLLGWGINSAFADPDCHRDYDHQALPDGKCYCTPNAVTYQSGCEANPENDGWPINQVSSTQYCAYLKNNPMQEHRILIFYEHALCAKGGGREQGGEDITHCESPGLFAAAGSLPGIAGGMKIRRQAYVCAKATGIPKEYLYFHLRLGDRQFEPADCPHWPQNTNWRDGSPRGGVKGIPGEYDVPAVCYEWSLP